MDRLITGSKPGTAGDSMGGTLPARRIALRTRGRQQGAITRLMSPSDLGRVVMPFVLLGSHGGASSPIPSPSPMNYLGVRLAAGESWRYEPPRGHLVAWLAVHSGRLSAQEPIPAGEMVVFEESNQAIDLHARTDTVF